MYPHILLEPRTLSEIRRYLALGTNEADISKFLAEMHAARFQEVRDQ